MQNQALTACGVIWGLVERNDRPDPREVSVYKSSTDTRHGWRERIHEQHAINIAERHVLTGPDVKIIVSPSAAACGGGCTAPFALAEAMTQSSACAIGVMQSNGRLRPQQHRQ